ncbi:hypothetical protein JIN84_14095 [Luteolibacter yonseiensis]|uniref:Potassium channel domain-containing protein n=1 Tax=Luteolibacter yonseiensis TaxID=1144680 RepID=A0A934R1P1_9BACT|nr:hypothetical protein [Luteolibacter yonseiensis]MBK1816753.1 hypothetical protein [Luteolibacter yonseiensis]
MFDYEKRGEALISRTGFMRRIARSFMVIILLVGASLGAGMAGYRVFEHLPWTDCFLNASMLLGGMGPVDEMKTEAGKLFSGFYALYSGLAFLVLAGLLFAPVAHRILHRFHYDDEEEKRS